MITAGLHHLAANKRATATWQRTKAASESCDPRTSHEARTEASKLDAEAALIDQQIQSDTDLITNIESLIHYLNNSPHKSAYRTLALRDLESASARLTREIGHPVFNDSAVNDSVTTPLPLPTDH